MKFPRWFRQRGIEINPPSPRAVDVLAMRRAVDRASAIPIVRHMMCCPWCTGVVQGGEPYHVSDWMMDTMALHLYDDHRAEVCALNKEAAGQAANWIKD